MPCTLPEPPWSHVDIAGLVRDARAGLQQLETYNPVTYEEIENPDPTEG